MCQVCDKGGHIAINCSHKFDSSYQGPDSTNGNGLTGSNGRNSKNHQAYIATLETVVDDAWCLDSGANNHITSGCSRLMTNTTNYTRKEKMVVGNGSRLQISHIRSSYYNASKQIHLQNILHVPKMTKNPVSISKFTLNNDAITVFTSDYCYVKDKHTKEIVLQGILKERLY